MQHNYDSSIRKSTMGDYRWYQTTYGFEPRLCDYQGFPKSGPALDAARMERQDGGARRWHPINFD